MKPKQNNIFRKRESKGIMNRVERGDERKRERESEWRERGREYVKIYKLV